MVVKQAALAAVAAMSALNSSGQFTPVDMLTTPRPQPAIAAPGGKHALSVVDQWDDKKDVTTRTVYLLQPGDASAEPKKLFSSPTAEAKEFLWLSSTVAAYVNGSALLHFNIDAKDKKSADGDDGEHDAAAPKTMHILDFPTGTEPSSLTYEPESHTLAFSAAVWGPDGALDDTGARDKEYADRGDTGVVFDDLFVRHWDTWRTPGRVYTLAATTLNRRKNKEGDDEFVVESKDKGRKFTNLLKGTGLYSQMDPIGDFTLSPTHVAIALKPPHLNPATHTRVEVYLLQLDSPGARPLQLTPGSQGAIAGVTFSPNYRKLAWLQMAKDGYESDRNVVVVHTLGGDGAKIGDSQRWTSEWDRSPSTVVWSHDSDSLYLLAGTKGKVLPYHIKGPGRLPTPLTFKHATSAIAQLTSDTFLLSTASMTSPTEIFLLDLFDEPGRDPHKQPAEDLRQLTHYATKHIGGRLDEQKPEELWFKGEDGRPVMAWVLKPRGFKEHDKSKWPMAFLIHGGPQGAWEDSWSTRWNPAVYASAGYFVVAVNPTGSTGYGQVFTDRIQLHWGDRPYQDLLAGYRAALDRFPQIDSERTAALGASYGGYMINWINGHNAFGFKALVYHDGIFDTTYTYYATEEVYFPNQEFGGNPTTARATFERWNPANFVQEWSTPQLVIQGGRDFRLDESQAISTFTALQLQGVPSRFLYFADENHWVLKPTNSRRWHHEVFRWLDEWVGDKKAAPNGA